MMKTSGKTTADVSILNQYRNLRQIKRCNTMVTLVSEDVAQHSYYVALLAHKLAYEYNSVVANPLFSGYVSQLAESVTLPDDEFETETIPQGPVEYEMPKKVKLANINVTYLEDSLETVYNFHKAWFQAIRCGKGCSRRAGTKSARRSDCPPRKIRAV